MARKLTPREKLRRDIRRTVNRLVKAGAPSIGHWTGGEAYRKILEQRWELDRLLGLIQ